MDVPAILAMIGYEGDIGYTHWPKPMQALYQKRKTNQERLTLFLFLVGNGLFPELAKTEVLRGYNYDKEATRQMDWLVSQSHSGGSLQRYTYYDWQLGKQQQITFY